MSANPTGHSSAVFQKTWDEFRRDLTQAEQDDMACTSLGDLQKCILDIQKDIIKRQKKVMNMARLRAFLEAMDQYGKVVETFLNSSNVVAFVWGPMKFVLQVAHTFSEAFEELLDMYADIGESLPMFEQYETLFRDAAYPHMRAVLELVYKDVMKFHHQAYKYFRQRVWKQLFKATWKTFRSQFQPIFDDIRRHKRLIETQAGLYQFEEIQQLRTRAEIEFQNLRDAEDRSKQIALQDWLSAVSVDEDQDFKSSARSNYPGVCKWILKEPRFKAWQEGDPNANSLLWLTGMPGSGKTILTSFIIEELQQTTSSHVLFFYCKYNDIERNSFLAIARALIGQIILQNSMLIPYAYEESLKSVEKPLRTVKLAKKILDVAVKSLNNIYIVIDGLDECDSAEKAIIASWFRELTHSANDEGVELRCLFSCQNDEITSKALRGMPSVHINARNLQNDLRIYCNREVEELQKKFELEDAECEEIAVKVINEAQDMFLYAKLVLDNLISQTRLSNLKRELQPGTFPRTLKQAYARIVERILDPESSNSDDARQLLNILACVKRSLKWHEVQGAVSIDVEGKTVDFRERAFCVDAKTLCGSLVETRPSGAIELVHNTTRQYLIENSCLCLRTEEFNIASLCLAYLGMKCFEASLTQEAIQLFAGKGHYAFANYAIVHWADHLLTAVELGLGGHQLDRLTKSIKKFLDSHFVQQQPSEWAPDVYKSTLQVFSLQSFFINLVQSVALLNLRRNPGLMKKHDEQLPEVTDNNLNIEEVLRDIREAIERFSNTSKIEEYYGNKLFKCDRIDCSSFYEGFLDSHAAQEHIKKHSHRWYCTVQGCASGADGFASNARLRDHQRNFHSINGHEGDFPAVYDWSSYCLREAVQLVDITYLKRYYSTAYLDKSRDALPNPEKPIFSFNTNQDKTIWREAIKYMDEKMLNFLISFTNFRCSNAQSYILESAVEMGKMDAIRRFIGQEYRKDPRKPSTALLLGDRAIHAAIGRNNLPMLKELLAPSLNGPNASRKKFKDKIRDICIDVCQLGYLEMVEYFIKCVGVDALTQNRELAMLSPISAQWKRRKCSMLYHAVEWGHEDIVQYLLRLQSPKERRFMRKEDIVYLLRTAAVNGHVDILAMIADRYDQVTKAHYISSLKLSLAYLNINGLGESQGSFGAFIDTLTDTESDIPDRYGWTPLSYAAYVGDEKIVKMLLAKGASCKREGYLIPDSYETFLGQLLRRRKFPVDIAYIAGHHHIVEILESVPYAPTCFTKYPVIKTGEATSVSEEKKHTIAARGEKALNRLMVLMKSFEDGDEMFTQYLDTMRPRSAGTKRRRPSSTNRTKKRRTKDHIPSSPSSTSSGSSRVESREDIDDMWEDERMSD